MSNQWFQFKQFTITQDNCAMKVTTDACILGAWVPLVPGIKRILDIGAGTGLLSLMMAQRNTEVVIDAVEKDEQAAHQAKENAAQSPWRDRINVVAADIRDYDSSIKYDLIITNPPFFNNSLLGDTVAKNNARHTISLSYNELLQAIDLNLVPGGYAAILLPFEEGKLWKSMAESEGWHCFRQLNVLHRPGAAAKRVVLLMDKHCTGDCEHETLVIQNEGGDYTPGFRALMAPFYLKL